MTDYTAAVDALAKFEYSRGRSMMLENLSLDENQIPTYEDTEPNTTLALREDALDAILEIEPHLETIVLSNILEEQGLPVEVSQFLMSRIMSNELDNLLTPND